MSFEKRYTAKEAALAVLKKTEELLKFSRLAKAENPDEKQDAKLGEDVEHLCEDHMIENKAAEKKEGHKLVQKSECMKCNLVKPTPASGQGDTLRRDAADREWQMDKSEFADLSGDFEKLEEMFKADTLSAKRGEISPGGHVRSAQRAFTHAKNPNASSPKIERKMGKESMAAAKVGHAKKLAGIKSQPKPNLTRSEDEGVGSKKLGYKPSKLGAEEKQPEPSDKAFEVEGKEHKSSDDPRMGHTNGPDKDPKEGAEGNNAEPGSKPGVESHPGQDAPPITQGHIEETKGHLKLAKFIGRMEFKRGLRSKV